MLICNILGNTELQYITVTISPTHLSSGFPRLACTYVPSALYSLLDDAPDDGLVIVRNM